jgi:hypothetical protein
MKKNLAHALLATGSCFLCSTAVAAEHTTVCFGGTALTTAIPLPTRAMLEGKTVKVRYFADKANHSQQTLESESITQKFTATSITESLGAETYADDITWEGNGWCRFDTKTAQKKCYGLVSYPLDVQIGHEVLHVEIDPDTSQFCKGRILAKVEGATVPEGVIPAPRTGTRRRG